MADTEDTQFLSVRLPRALYSALQQKAEREDRSLASLVRLAVKDLLADDEGK